MVETWKQGQLAELAERLSSRQQPPLEAWFNEICELAAKRQLLRRFKSGYPDGTAAVHKQTEKVLAGHRICRAPGPSALPRREPADS